MDILRKKFPARRTANEKALRQGHLTYLQYSKETSVTRAKWGRKSILRNEITEVAGSCGPNRDTSEDFGSCSA